MPMPMPACLNATYLPNAARSKNAPTKMPILLKQPIPAMQKCKNPNIKKPRQKLSPQREKIRSNRALKVFPHRIELQLHTPIQLRKTLQDPPIENRDMFRIPILVFPAEFPDGSLGLFAELDGLVWACDVD